MDKERNALGMLVGEHQGKSTLERLGRRRNGYSKMNVNKTGCDGLYWIQLAQDTVAGRCEHANEHSCSVK
jgi:hypothetical protein